jgi:hypothetical protein
VVLEREVAASCWMEAAVFRLEISEVLIRNFER